MTFSSAGIDPIHKDTMVAQPETQKKGDEERDVEVGQEPVDIERIEAVYR
jgi:hypothetical protein